MMVQMDFFAYVIIQPDMRHIFECEDGHIYREYIHFMVKAFRVDAFDWSIFMETPALLLALFGWSWHFRCGGIHTTKYSLLGALRR